MRTLHWFRSDLRLRDNRSLDWCAAHSECLALLFVFDEALLQRERHGSNRIRFLHDCVQRLAAELARRGQHLIVRRGDPQTWVPRIARDTQVDSVSFNRDIIPRAQARDEAVCAALRAEGREVHSHIDHVVFGAADVVTGAGRPYAVYSPYRRAWWDRFQSEPPPAGVSRRLPPPPHAPGPLEVPEVGALLGARGDTPDRRLPTGGEAAAERRLRAFLERDSAGYAEARDFPARHATSRLSPYLRFGVISARRCFEEALAWKAETPHAAQGVGKWLDELIWREFYNAILETHPRVLRGAFRPAFDALQWSDDRARFQAWCEGRTGYPFVDAAMRQLVETGWMHNRGRMVVASFLVKDLWIDWRWGERFFLEHLVDGDPASNNGGWQWSASTGTDAQPYFRIFNPVSQSERFDPTGDYIRRFVPELRALEGPDIHRPWRAPLACPGYPAPIVDHAVARKHALEQFERLR